ncbi:MAG: hypothetical protein GXO71_00880 [Caldiserica bacterium]|nr:hypothetical protein [Caldisericota bacterium]
MLKVIPPSGTPFQIKHLMKSYFTVPPIKEEFMQEYLSKGNIFFTSSGRMALYTILKSLKKCYPRRDRVIIPAYTCPVIPRIIQSLGMKILLSDLEKDSLFMAKKEVERLWDEKTLCLVPVHLFGYPHPLWKEFPSVEDAAQALGAEIAGKKTGTQGMAGFFSLGKGKNLTTDKGGIIFTKDKKLSREIEKELAGYEFLHPLPSFIRLLLFSLLIKPCGWGIITNLNLPQEETSEFSLERKKLSSFHQRLLHLQLGNYQEIIKERAKRAKLLQKYLSSFPQVKLISPAKNSKPCYLRFPILVKRKRALLEKLFLSKGWGVTRMYQKSLPEFYPHIYINQGEEFPSASTLSRELLTLPTLGYTEEKAEEDLKWIKERWS